MNSKTFLALGVCVGLVGCSTAPGTSGQQGAVVGGVGGAAVGASVTKNRALGAIIGGAVGAAGGYVIGQKTGPLDNRREDEEHAQSNPATAEQANGAPTADLNHDGFVTLDEVVALEKTGLSDDEMTRRIEATGLTFDLNEDQRKYLRDRGVSETVINRLPTLNRGAGFSAPTQGSTVINR